MHVPSRAKRVGAGRSQSRRGFTLVELLVVISIIAVLASLILPGVMNARRAARRAQCLNNMKQVGIAFIDFYTTNNSFPASGRIDVDDTVDRPTTMGNLLAELTDPAISQVENYSPNAPTPGTEQPYGMRYSWVREMLPRLDRSDIFDVWDTTRATSFGTYLNQGDSGNVGVDGKRAPGGPTGLTNTDLRVLVCPEDITTQPGKGNLSFVVNGGFTPHPEIFPTGVVIDVNATDSTQAALNRQLSQNLFRMGLMYVEGPKKERRHTAESVKDGLTTTVMMSENVNAGYAEGVSYNGGTPVDVINWACPHPANTSFFVQSPLNTDDDTRVIPEDALDPRDERYYYPRANTRGPITGGINGDVTGLYEFGSPYPSSFHTGGVHIMMCDGGVRFMSDAVAGEIWARLVTPDGGRVLGPNTVPMSSPPRLSQQFEDFDPAGNTQIPIQENQIP